MKSHTITFTILLFAMAVSANAQVSPGKYITRKSTMVTGRTMNNVTAVMECDGIKFVIPPGSIDPSFLVSLYKEEGDLIVKSGKPGDKIVRLAVDTKKFDGPVEIYIPIKNPEKIPVAYAVDKSDAWEPLTLKQVTPDKSTAIYLTYKPVTVAWVTPE